MMPKKSFRNIKEYWNDQARKYGADRRATTPDYWLREIEIKEIAGILRGLKRKKTVLDIGCGNGFSTLRLAKMFPKSKFLGGDFSSEMIKYAGAALRRHSRKIKNVSFEMIDILDLQRYLNRFDVIISDRCLINLPTRKHQAEALTGIAGALRPGGHLVMIENFIEGHLNMNKLRKRMGLGEIPVRWHNNYLNEDFIVKNMPRFYETMERKNITSLYYLLTRVVYSKMCQLEQRGPDYDHSIYRIAAALDEEAGDWSPIKLIVLKKKRKP